MRTPDKSSFSSELLEAIIVTAVDGIITISDKGIIRSLNPAAAKLFGYASEEAMGCNVNMLMPNPHREEHDQYLSRYMKTGEAKIIGIGREVMGRKKDGSLFPLKLAVSQIVIPDGCIFVGIIHDLTEQKAAENTLKRNAEELEQQVEQRTKELHAALRNLERSHRELASTLEKERELNELKSRFVSLASHEFRTPLSTVLSSVSLIERYRQAADEDKRQKHVLRIKGAVQNLTGILNDFLSLEKIESGLIEPQYEAFNIVAFGYEITDEMQEVAKNGQRITYRHTGEDAEVCLDPQLMKNILINLISNAIKYSGENTEIFFSTRTSLDQVVITVKDQGMGIPAADQVRLFDRFHRGNNVQHVQGTGLGLHIVKRYVELMHGNITFVSEENVGTVFMLVFSGQSAQKLR